MLNQIELEKGGREDPTGPIIKLPYDGTNYVLLEESVLHRKCLSQEKFQIE